MPSNLIESTQQVLQARYGQSVADIFLSKLNHYSSGNFVAWMDMPPNQQIKHLNGFWRVALCTFPNTTELRAWLCEGDDINAYISAFANDWSDGVVATGLFGECRES